MAEKTYSWNGPPTAIEVVSPGKKDGDAPIVIFEGMAGNGRPIAKPLPEDHHQVKAWLAFNLITEIVAEAPAAQPESPQKNRKEA